MTVAPASRGCKGMPPAHHHKDTPVNPHLFSYRPSMLASKGSSMYSSTPSPLLPMLLWSTEDQPVEARSSPASDAAREPAREPAREAAFSAQASQGREVSEFPREGTCTPSFQRAITMRCSACLAHPCRILFAIEGGASPRTPLWLSEGRRVGLLGSHQFLGTLDPGVWSSINSQ